MTVVVADTSPLNYLILIGSIDILPRLYGAVVVPPEVINELMDPGTPVPVSDWIRLRPAWLVVESAELADDSLADLIVAEVGEILPR